MNLCASTENGIASLLAFINEMPDKFEHKNINLNLKRVGLAQAVDLARSVRQIRPKLIFRTLSLS